MAFLSSNQAINAIKTAGAAIGRFASKHPLASIGIGAAGMTGYAMLKYGGGPMGYYKSLIDAGASPTEAMAAVRAAGGPDYARWTP